MQDDLRPMAPGQLIARGACRYLRKSLDFVCVEELTLTTGRRVDIMAIGPKGELWVVECKSSRADFNADSKWGEYLDWCDRYFWAVDSDFPLDLLPEDTGLIMADAYGGELIRMGPETRLSGARRKALTLRIARNAMGRLQDLRDPRVSGVFSSV